MPNIEIKAICLDIQTSRSIAQTLKTSYVGELHQIDTYYETKEGRLKLREIGDEEAQLIPYYKDYSTGPMKSNYSVLPVTGTDNLKMILSKILGEITVVDKLREVFLVDNIRIHLDAVKGLGTFIEFEAVYEEKTPADKEREIKKVDELIKVFKIEKAHLLNRSYIDYFLDESTNILFDDLRVLFYFTTDSHSVLEIEKLNVSKKASPDKRYFWLLFDKETRELTHLNFTSMKSEREYEYRELGDVKLKFDLEGAELRSPKLVLSLKRKHSMFLSEHELDMLKQI